MDQSLFIKLQGLGLNQYEAKAYVALLSLGTSNAYNISKNSGIPRARIYDILESLTLRGVVMLEENADGAKNYTALPVKVFLEQAREKWDVSFLSIESELKAIEKKGKQQDNYVSTFKGEDNILAFCRNLIRDAKKKVLISIWDPMYSELELDLEDCINRGCNVRGITFGVNSPLGSLDKHRNMKIHKNFKNMKWFILSVDDKELLYGHSSEANGNAFYTDDPTHIFLMEDYIYHDIILNRVFEKENDEQETFKITKDIFTEMDID